MHKKVVVVVEITAPTEFFIMITIRCVVWPDVALWLSVIAHPTVPVEGMAV
jgi:hypothetical protein